MLFRLISLKPLRYFFSGILVILTLFFNDCSKGEEGISSSPEISLIHAGPQVIKAFTDSIYFSIEYIDGDGDIGSNDAEQENLFVEDTRMGLIYAFRIHQLSPKGTNPGIKGRLNFSLENTVLSGKDSEIVTYKIWLIDRAGHKSNNLNAGPFEVVE